MTTSTVNDLLGRNKQSELQRGNLVIEILVFNLEYEVRHKIKA